MLQPEADQPHTVSAPMLLTLHASSDMHLRMITRSPSPSTQTLSPPRAAHELLRPASVHTTKAHQFHLHRLSICTSFTAIEE